MLARRRVLEINHILLEKINNEEKDKINAYETDSKTVSYKHKGKKIKFHDSESSSGLNIRSHRDRYKYTSDIEKETINLEKESIKLMKKFLGNLKR